MWLILSILAIAFVSFWFGFIVAAILGSTRRAVVRDGDTIRLRPETPPDLKNAMGAGNAAGYWK